MPCHNVIIAMAPFWRAMRRYFYWSAVSEIRKYIVALKEGYRATTRPRIIYSTLHFFPRNVGWWPFFLNFSFWYWWSSHQTWTSKVGEKKTLKDKCHSDSISREWCSSSLERGGVLRMFERRVPTAIFQWKKTVKLTGLFLCRGIVFLYKVVLKMLKKLFYGGKMAKY